MDISFKQIYMQNISPKLIGIDLFLKTNEAPYNHVEVALVLGMPVQEVLSIMTKHSIPSITLVDFFTIVMHSSSYICRLIQRQWKYAQVDQYTPKSWLIFMKSIFIKYKLHLIHLINLLYLHRRLWMYLTTSIPLFLL